MTDVNFARIAYDAYKGESNLPDYGSLDDATQKQWAAAVQAVQQYQSIGDTEVAQETVPVSATPEVTPSSDPLNPVVNHNTAYDEAPDADEIGWADSDAKG